MGVGCRCMRGILSMAEHKFLAKPKSRLDLDDIYLSIYILFLKALNDQAALSAESTPWSLEMFPPLSFPDTSPSTYPISNGGFCVS